ncbi:two pore domain potassium channel family protein [Candidatus Woesearchaeota archaeon]|nr:two pore domain potassium channel family protein [Candidatus Woesearchaeota archaeon]
MHFTDINNMFRDMKRKSLTRWIDKLTFTRILLLWIIIIILFGIAFYYLHDDSSYLFYTPDRSIPGTIFDSIYFSFVTATTTGFGDMIPFGWLKLVAIAEVICGLLLLALVTSKLVSIKQDIILDEIYVLSLNEKTNRLRSSMLLFRQNLDRLLSKVEEGVARKREISNLYLTLSSFEDTLNEIPPLFSKSDNHFIKNIDALNAELLAAGVISSFEKLNEALLFFE